MQRETPEDPRYRRRLRTAALTVSALATAVGLSAATPATAAPATATPATATPAPATPASSGPRAASDPAAQQTTSMMPAGSPDAAPTVGGHHADARVARAASTAAAATYLQGVDVASYQHPNGAPITWAAVRASGQSFAIVKATEGTTYTNTYVTGDAAGARAAGLQIGLYHFAEPGLIAGSAPADAVAEADHFARQITAVGGAQLPPTLDLEVSGGLTPAQLVSWTAAFLSRVQSDTGRRPMIYTGPGFWNASVQSTAFASYPLWEAHYTTAAEPYSFGGWSTWTLWQWTDGSYFTPAVIGGIPGGSVDRNRYAGSAAQLAGFASASTGSVAPFTGTASAATYPNGSLVVLAGSPAVYEIAGLAPVFVSSWASIGGVRPYRVLSAAQFYSLRSSPSDGTWLVARQTGQVFRVAGGAAVYVNTFAPFHQVSALVPVGLADISQAGAPGYWSHLLARPRDGTFVVALETGQVFRFAGGAPVYVSNWATFGGPQPSTGINVTAVERAGTSLWTSVNYSPADGTYLAGSATGTYWVMSGGRLTPVADTGQAFTVESDSAILNRGLPGVWSHLH